MLRFVVKLWPALLPIIFYLIWVYLIDRILIQRIFRKKDEIDGEKIVGEGSTAKLKESPFSLKNQKFLLCIYSAMVTAIAIMIKLGIEK